MHGRVVLDGVVYEDFGLATGYFGKGPYGALGDRLQGVNCRHFFGPYLHGQPRTYSETPDEDAGYERGEVYKNTQTQRAYEREIRRTKRRIAALEGAGLSGSPEHSVECIKLGGLQRELKKHVDSHAYLHRRYGRERASELKRQPRSLGAPAQSKARAKATKELIEQCSKTTIPVWDKGYFGSVARSAYKAIANDGTEYYNIFAHGSSTVIQLYGKAANPDTIRRILKKREDYSDGTPIRLFSCSTGKVLPGEVCFAQRLANIMGVEVIAPTEKVFVLANEEYYVLDNETKTSGFMKAFKPQEEHKL